MPWASVSFMTVASCLPSAEVPPRGAELLAAPCWGAGLSPHGPALGGFVWAPGGEARVLAEPYFWRRPRGHFQRRAFGSVAWSAAGGPCRRGACGPGTWGTAPPLPSCPPPGQLRARFSGRQRRLPRLSGSRRAGPGLPGRHWPPLVRVHVSSAGSVSPGTVTDAGPGTRPRARERPRGSSRQREPRSPLSRQRLR